MEHRVVAKVIVVSSEGKVLLLRRSETDVRRPLQWDIPGGHTDENEFSEEAAVRETKEETGIDLHARNLQLVYAISDVVQHDLNVTWLFFVGHVDNPDVTISNEHQEHAWYLLDEAINVIDYDRQKKAFEYIRDNRLL
ncbi:MAG TPA: NUDIX hydrolase [Candidatus Saccharimonadales bacterium]|nr:NUDIX hydrolase [Candidatus Saccharimonadales bacterium]